ncbi:restriction endonuclease [Kaistella antarctica]|uniref:Restriction endonuclease n=1 Tax=Kaistella antarctica TaxID=266748 RepID=A0A3S4W6B8_9FLAO|nr:restriction endonuclease [Kaistella antarctica]SEV90730.1 Restriction endonuclease [Kaistella antarctica]VEI01522.1 Restriction endonuclease [Kaistella antarctica]
MKLMKFFSEKFSDYLKKLNEIKLLNKDLEVKINSKYTDTLTKIESLKVIAEKIQLEKNQLDVQTKSRLDQIEIETNYKKNELEELTQNLQNVYDKTFNSVEWLSNKYAEFYFLLDKKRIVMPVHKIASKCSDAQIMFSRENRNLRKRNMSLELQLKQIESLIPEVEDLIDTTPDDIFLDDSTQETEDKIDILVSETEKKQLSKTEILQKALDNYVKRKMNKSEVGADYERYIGHIYEKKGYKVIYHGIKKGINDLGIDLICKKGSETLLIQCKNWRRSIQIHENAINQLFGTSMKYYLDNYDHSLIGLKGTLFEEIGIPFDNNLQPIFVTTTDLTDRALEFANALKIKIVIVPYEKNYPRIKCNIGKDGKIYHLPFDQKYDITQNINNGGVNALTIVEAEKLGYRKAFRWRGE